MSLDCIRYDHMSDRFSVKKYNYWEKTGWKINFYDKN